MIRMLSVFLFLLLGSTAFAAGMTEQQKIDALLDKVGKSDITFIRNGEAHDAAWGEKHLQDKLGNVVPKVTTAEDFITKVASVSRETNKPYIIQLKDGTKVESNTWLHQQLALIEKADGKNADNKKDSSGKN